MIKLRAKYIEEQDLIFGNQQEEKDPRLGLRYHGPYFYPSESAPLPKIRLGIIGTRSTIDKAKRIISLVGSEVKSPSCNKWLFPPYSGMSNKTSFKCDLELSDTFQQTITEHEVSKILEITDVNERIGSAVELLVKKFENIIIEDDRPSVILCAIPHDIEKYCGISEFTRGAKTPKPTILEKQVAEFKTKNQRFLDEWGLQLSTKKPKTVKGYDLRNALKGRIMAVPNTVPIQILRESTADEILEYDSRERHLKQDPASFAWNFSTALYYKAHGKPWRLAKLRQDTCYVGISFYKNKLDANQNMETAMAQVFTHNGEGLVLRGADVTIDSMKKEAHLSQKQAEDLMKEILQKYEKKAGRMPTRVVVHKSTLFSEEEKKGFQSAISNIPRDFITISLRHGYRFLRWGAYPVLRGTVITLSDQQHILYSAGYTPRIRTYPGHSIPQPLLITHIGDSQIEEIAREILGLTKLNWNTTSFSTRYPITLEFAGKVGRIMSELDKSQPVQDHYRFYM